MLLYISSTSPCDLYVLSLHDALPIFTAENPALADYKVLSVKKELFGNVDVSDSFFDSFRTDYQGFDGWFNRKAEDRKSTRLNSSHLVISYAVFCLKKKKLRQMKTVN